MSKCDPYVLFPRELWTNMVAFAGMVNVDVYVVILNSIREHMRKESADWTDEQKADFSRRLGQLNRLFKE